MTPTVEEEHIRGISEDRTPDSSATEDPGSGWVTTRTADRALRIEPRTVRKYISQGKLEAKVQGEGVQKAYLVSVDSIYALRDSRPGPRHAPEDSEERSAASADSGDPVRILAELVGRHAAEAAEYRTRLELTERTESSLREEVERLRTELEAERGKSIWQRLFGR